MLLNQEKLNSALQIPEGREDLEGGAPALYEFSSELASSLVDAADDRTSLPLDLLAHKCLYIQTAVGANGFDGFFFWVDSDLPQPEMVFWFLMKSAQHCG